MAKLFKHFGLGNDKTCINVAETFDDGAVVGAGKFRRIGSHEHFSRSHSQGEKNSNEQSNSFRPELFRNIKNGIDNSNINFHSLTNQCLPKHSFPSHIPQKNIQFNIPEVDMSKPMVVLFDDYSDPLDVIRQPESQSDIYCDPTECQAISKSQSLPTCSPQRIYDVPPDDDYTDPYESGLTHVIKPETVNKRDSLKRDEALNAFAFLENDDSTSVIYDVPPDIDDAVLYDVPPPLENSDPVAYDMPWEWLSGAHIRTNLNVGGDRTSLSSHDSSGSQNSFGSAGSSSSGGRRRLFYETAFDSVVQPKPVDKIIKKIQNQANFGGGSKARESDQKTDEKHSNKVLVNITPKDKQKVTLLKNKTAGNVNGKPAGFTLKVQATIEHSGSLDNRAVKIKKPKHHSFSDFDQLRRKINENKERKDLQKPAVYRSSEGDQDRKEMSGITLDLAAQNFNKKNLKLSGLNDEKSVDYEPPWDLNKTESHFRKMALDNRHHICDNKNPSAPPEQDTRSDADYDKPWDTKKSKFEAFNLNKQDAGEKSQLDDDKAQNNEETACSGLVDGINANVNSITSLPQNKKPDDSIAPNFASKPASEPTNNVDVILLRNTGAIPKACKDSCQPIIRPKMSLDFNQSARRPRQNLNLNFGCSALSAIGEKIDLSIPLEQQGWYHGSISRVDAENLLRVLKEGSYLVRNSESCKQDFSLSLKSAKGFMHMKIVNRNNKFILGQFSKPFNSIPEMIQHYAMNKLPIRGAEHMSLLYPVIDQLL